MQADLPVLIRSHDTSAAWRQSVNMDHLQTPDDTARIQIVGGGGRCGLAPAGSQVVRIPGLQARPLGGGTSISTASSNASRRTWILSWKKRSIIGSTSPPGQQLSHQHSVDGTIRAVALRCNRSAKRDTRSCFVGGRISELTTAGASPAVCATLVAPRPSLRSASWLPKNLGSGVQVGPFRRARHLNSVDCSDPKRKFKIQDDWSPSAMVFLLRSLG